MTTDKQTATWEDEYDEFIEDIEIGGEEIKSYIKQNFTHNSECISKDEVREIIGEYWVDDPRCCELNSILLLIMGKLGLDISEYLTPQESEKANHETK